MCRLEFILLLFGLRPQEEILTMVGILGISILLCLHLIFFWKNIKTNRKLAHTIEQLEQTNQLKDRFFSIISHDLKGPFNGILGLSNYLLEDYGKLSEPEKKELVSDINLASKNAFNLLQNLLNWARAQTGNMVFHPSTIHSRQIIDFSLETVLNQAHKKQIEIRMDVKPELTFVADENMVSTILRNLVENAIKFSPRNSLIEIATQETTDQVIFSVKDQGIGFTEEEIGQLFRLDVSFQKKGTELEPGTGLGLILCNDLAKRMNGKLWLDSKPGEGSTFYLSLPGRVAQKPTGTEAKGQTGHNYLKERST